METRDSLNIILQMVENAKSAYRRMSPFFLIWGILLALAGLGEYVFVHLLHWKHGYFMWPLMGTLGGIFSSIIGRKQRLTSSVRTYHDLTFQFLWTAFTISLILVIVMSVINHINPTPYILLMTGVPTITSGGMLKSTPLKIGGIIFWISGIIAFLIPQEYTGPLFSLALVLGYLWPGWQLRKSEKQFNQPS